MGGAQALVGWERGERAEGFVFLKASYIPSRATMIAEWIKKLILTLSICTEMELENISSAIVPLNSKNISTIAISSEKVLEKLRSDREAHKHKQIWTKDAHGGPYRKVGAALCWSNFIAHLSSLPLKLHVVTL